MNFLHPHTDSAQDRLAKIEQRHKGMDATNHQSSARASLPAGSKARKKWTPEEEMLLLHLRHHHPSATWGRMQPIFNSNVHASRHRTPDAVACKYKSIKLKNVPSQSIPYSQGNLSFEPYSQLGQVVDTCNETVSCSFTLRQLSSDCMTVRAF